MAAKLISGYPPIRVGMECQVHFKCTLCALYESRVRIEKNPTIIELKNRSFDPRGLPRTLHLPAFLGPPLLAAEPQCDTTIGGIRVSSQ